MTETHSSCVSRFLLAWLVIPVHRSVTVNLDEVFDQVSFLDEVLRAFVALKLSDIQVHSEVVLEVVNGIKQQTTVIVATLKDHRLLKVEVVQDLEGLVQVW